MNQSKKCYEMNTDMVIFFMKNQLAASCSKQRLLEVLAKDIVSAPSLGANWPTIRTEKNRLSGTVRDDRVFLTSGRLQNMLISSIIRGTVMGKNDRECELVYQFVPCNTFFFTVAIVNWWLVEFIMGMESNNKTMLIVLSLVLVDIIIFGNCMLQCWRTKRLLCEEIEKAKKDL